MLKRVAAFLFPLPLNQSAIKWLPVAVLALILDQVTKYLALDLLPLGASVHIFPGLNFSLVYNYGAAFGFLNQGIGWQQLFFSFIAITAGLAFIFWLARTPKTHKWEGIGIALLLGGAIGNLVDRLQHGYVIDFLRFLCFYLALVCI